MPKQIMVTTIHQGIFAGTVPTNQNMSADPMTLTECRLIDFWDTDDDVGKLATVGPGEYHRISLPATVSIRDLTAIWNVEPAAWALIEAGTWKPEREKGRTWGPGARARANQGEV